MWWRPGRSQRLWRGSEPLANVAGHALQGDAEGLRRRRRRIATRLFSMEVSRGRHEVVLDDLQRFAAEDGTDTSICRLLMTALYLSGQSSAALQVFDRHAQAIESRDAGRPDPALRDLSYAMSNHQDEVVERAAGPPPCSGRCCSCPTGSCRTPSC